MSQQNVDLLRSCWEAVAASGPEALLDFADPALEWHVRTDLPDARVYRGHEGFRELVARFDESFGVQRYHPVDYIDAGDRIVVPLRWSAVGRESGAAVVERDETWIFTVEGGKIRRVDEYSTRGEALEAVGLSE